MMTEMRKALLPYSLGPDLLNPNPPKKALNPKTPKKHQKPLKPPKPLNPEP